MYRGHLTNPEVLTFDELLERARFVVQSEEETRQPGEIGIDDMPF
jgi:hypothetical protein